MREKYLKKKHSLCPFTTTNVDLYVPFKVIYFVLIIGQLYVLLRICLEHRVNVFDCLSLLPVAVSARFIVPGGGSQTKYKDDPHLFWV